MYRPGPPPTTIEPELARYIADELESVSAALEQSNGIAFAMQSQLPARPQNGMLVYFAGGVAGAAEGFYGYEAGAWVKL